MQGSEPAEAEPPVQPHIDAVRRSGPAQRRVFVVGLERRGAAGAEYPRGGERPSLRVLHALAELFETSLEQIIDGDDLAAMPETDRHAVRNLVATVHDSDGRTGSQSRSVPQFQHSPYLEGDDSDIAEVVVMAAHEGSEHAEAAEQREIGDATLEQLRADVVRLSHAHMTDEPWPVFQEMRRVRNRIYAALDRRLWPRDQTDLYFLLGVLSGLMAASANGLGHQPAAEEMLRSGWVYATGIDHRALMAQLRLELAGEVYWERPRHGLHLARSGLEYLADGQIAAQLHLRYGRAAARIGDADGARRAITAAHEAAAQDDRNELLEIGGEFGLSRATQHFLAGGILLDIPDAEAEAAAELEQAHNLYDAGPEPGEDHYYAYAVCTEIDLATARLRQNQLEGAAESLTPLFSLPPNKRNDAVLRRISRVRRALAAPVFHDQTLAEELDQQVETFGMETIVADLGELPAGPR